MLRFGGVSPIVVLHFFVLNWRQIKAPAILHIFILRNHDRLTKKKTALGTCPLSIDPIDRRKPAS